MDHQAHRATALTAYAAGCEVSQEEWERVIDEFANERAGYPFIVQRYIRPFKTDTLPPDRGINEAPDGAVESEPLPYNNLNGLYLYNGHFQGVFSWPGRTPDFEDQRRHDRGHHLGRLRRARRTGAVNGIR